MISGRSTGFLRAVEISGGTPQGDESLTVAWPDWPGEHPPAGDAAVGTGVAGRTTVVGGPRHACLATQAEPPAVVFVVPASRRCSICWAARRSWEVLRVNGFNGMVGDTDVACCARMIAGDPLVGETARGGSCGRGVPSLPFTSGGCHSGVLKIGCAPVPMTTLPVPLRAVLC